VNPDPLPPAAPEKAAVPEAPALAPRLGLFDITMLVMGSVIGAGIFVVPHTVATLVPAPAPVLAAWVVGGLISMAGGLVYADLAAEVRDPTRTLPRGLILGVTGVIVLYLGVSLACLRVLGTEELAVNTSPAAAVMRRALGAPGAALAGPAPPLVAPSSRHKAAPYSRSPNPGSLRESAPSWPDRETSATAADRRQSPCHPPYLGSGACPFASAFNAASSSDVSWLSGSSLATFSSCLIAASGWPVTK
jgi:L-asparagine transporter-like permease